MGCKACKLWRRRDYAQALATHPVPFLPQRHLQPTGTVAAFRVPKGLDQRCFPGRFWLSYGLPLGLLLRVVAAGRYLRHLAEQPHRMLAPVPFDAAVTAHRLSVTKKRTMAVFKISNFCACRRLSARSCRNSAAEAGFSSAPRAAATGVSASFCHL